MILNSDKEYDSEGCPSNVPEDEESVHVEGVVDEEEPQDILESTTESFLPMSENVDMGAVIFNTEQQNDDSVSLLYCSVSRFVLT